MSAPTALLAQQLLVEAAFPRLTLPEIEQAGREADVDPFDLALELVHFADRTRAAGQAQAAADEATSLAIGAR